MVIVSEIHSILLIMLVNVTPFGGYQVLWYDAINPAERFIISMMGMPEYSQGHVYVCEK